jgi:hypothetical protein
MKFAVILCCACAVIAHTQEEINKKGAEVMEEYRKDRGHWVSLTDPGMVDHMVDHIGVSSTSQAFSHTLRRRARLSFVDYLEVQRAHFFVFSSSRRPMVSRSPASSSPRLLADTTTDRLTPTICPARVSRTKTRFSRLSRRWQGISRGLPTLVNYFVSFCHSQRF